MSEKDRVRVTFETEVPSHWRYVTLKELVPPGGVFSDGDWVESKDQDPEGDVRLVQLADIGDGRFLDKSDRYLTREKAGELNCTMLEEGDVLVARMPDPLGRACLFPGSTRPCCTVVDVCIIRTAENDVDHRWLMHAVNSPRFRAAVSSLKSGTTRERISRKNLARIEFPVPPLPEQRRIVAKIEELFSNLDAGMGDLQAAGQQLERYRLSILQAAVEGRLTTDWRRNHDPEPADQLLERILEKRRDLWEKQYRWERYDSKGKEPPSGWKDRYDEPKSPADEEELPDLPDRWLWTSLDAVTWNNIDYRGKTPPYSDSGIPTISAGNIKNGEVSFETRKKYVSEETYEEWLTRGEPEPGDLIITTEAPPGQTALLPEDQTYLLTRRVLACQTVHVDNRFLQLCFAIGPTERHVRGSSRGTTVDRILKKVLFKTPLPLPPIQEQKQIVDDVERLLSVADDAAATAEREHTRAERLRQSILKQAFSGRLVPHDEDAAPPSIDGTASEHSDSDTNDGSESDVEDLLGSTDPSKQIEMDL